MCMFTSFVGLHAGKVSHIDAYEKRNEPEKYLSEELKIFELVFELLYPRRAWWTGHPERRASFVRWLRRNQSEKYDVPEWPTIRNDYDLRNLRLELPSDAPPCPTWGEWRCVFHVIDMRAATRNQVLQWIRVVDHYGLVWWEFVPPQGWYPKFYDVVEYPHNQWGVPAFVSRGRGSAIASAVGAGVCVLGGVWTLDSVD